MNSSARRLAVFAACAASRERTVMVKASSPSPCTSVSLRSASTAASIPSFSRLFGYRLSSSIAVAISCRA